jgi:hypothetical protein
MVFDEIIRFEIELWNGVDARLKADCSVPVTHFEPMSVMDRFGPCRVHDIASELRITTGGASKLVASARRCLSRRCGSSPAPFVASGRRGTPSAGMTSRPEAPCRAARRRSGSGRAAGINQHILFNIF